MPTIFVTGGAGYVGSHICKALAKAGHTPVAYDNLFRGHEWAVRWGPFEPGDILDKARLAEAIGRHRPAGVVHCAALTYVGEGEERPEDYHRTNVAGTSNLLEAMTEAGVDTLVYSSSCTVYGVPDRLPITEDMPAEPVNTLGRTKLKAENAIRDFGHRHGLKWMALRYFNAAGADPDGETGEWHVPETHLIPRVLMAAAGDIDAVDILGDGHPTADGTCIRDYVHVADLAGAHVAAIGALADGTPSVALNLGSGRGASVKEVIEAVEKAVGKPVPARIAPARDGDPPELVASHAKARTVLGFDPALSDLGTIVETAWKWYRSRA